MAEYPAAFEHAMFGKEDGYSRMALHKTWRGVGSGNLKFHGKFQKESGKPSQMVRKREG